MGSRPFGARRRRNDAAADASLSSSRGLFSGSLAPAGDTAATATCKAPAPLPRRNKLRFTPPPAQSKPAPTASPRASEVIVQKPGTFSEAPLSPELKAKLLPDSQIVLGIDAWTNDWAEGPTKGSMGEYGFYSLCQPCNLTARIVHLGWALYDGQTVTSVERIVKLPGSSPTKLPGSMAYRMETP